MLLLEYGNYLAIIRPPVFLPAGKYHQIICENIQVPFTIELRDYLHISPDALLYLFCQPGSVRLVISFMTIMNLNSQSLSPASKNVTSLDKACEPP